MHDIRLVFSDSWAGPLGLGDISVSPVTPAGRLWLCLLGQAWVAWAWDHRILESDPSTAQDLLPDKCFQEFTAVQSTR